MESGSADQADRNAGMSRRSAMDMKAHPEIQLILACARATVDAEGAERIRALAAQQIDWPYLVRKALRNGVMPLVCLNLINICPDLLPDEVTVESINYWRHQARQNLLQTAELIKLLRLLEEQGILALPFKGPALASYAYGNLSLRQSCDLDILVRKQDIKRVVKLLTARGFKLVSKPTWIERLPTPASRKKDYGLVSDDGQIRVELHWRFSGTHFDLPVNLKSLWGRLETVPLAGYSVRSLPLDDLLLYLTMHGSRHGWERLIWICDIAELVRTHHEEIDWEQLFARASGLGGKRNLLLGLYLANDLLDAKLPRRLLRELESDPALKQLADQVGGFLFRDEGSSASISYWQDYHLKVKERFRERLRLRFHYSFRYLSLALAPNVKDFAMVPLPKYLSFVYYLLRPFRLIRKYSVLYWKSVGRS